MQHIDDYIRVYLLFWRKCENGESTEFGEGAMQGRVIQGFFAGRFPTDHLWRQPPPKSASPPAGARGNVTPAGPPRPAGPPQPASTAGNVRIGSYPGHPNANRLVALPKMAGEAFQLPAHVSAFTGARGKPLPASVQAKMESLFGTSFADVRVHIGPQPASIGALALACGSDLYFAPGQYNPDSVPGFRLLGHELSHVVQQKKGRVRNPFGSGIAVVHEPALEAEADRMGMLAVAQLMSGRAASTISTRPSSCPLTSGGGMAASPAIQLSRRSRRRAEQEEALTANAERLGVEIDPLPEIVKPGQARKQRGNRRRAERRQFEQAARNETLYSVNHLAQGDWKPLLEIIEAIEKTYPPGQWIYVGIGASPEVLIELLRRRGRNTKSIPLSGIKHAGPILEKAFNTPQIIKKNTDKDELELIYESHNMLDKAIREVSYHLGVFARQNKNIILLDATDTNASLIIIEKIIRISDQKYGVRRIVKSASISTTKATDNEFELIDATDIEILPVESKEARELMRARFYQQFYKTRLGRSVDQNPFKQVLESNRAVAPITNSKNRKYIINFANRVLIEKLFDDI